MKRLLIIVGVLVLLAGVGSFYALWAAPGPAEEPKTIIVEQGSSLAKVANQLEQAGAIRGGARTFRMMARVFGPSDPIQAGEFEIAPGMSSSKILDHLQHGQPIQRLVTIPEGTPSILVHERLMRVPYLTGSIPVPEEGSVLPNSYGYQRGETRAQVLKRMQDAMNKEFEALWAKRRAGLPVSNRREVITLASIVEKETGKPSERRMVAGVYTNRLRQGIPLQADPTVIYPVTKGKPLGRRILRSELNTNNGYNTYRMAGLPLGPIANPGRESIAAVLNPENTQALYFVADGTGGHVFANTLAEHNANVAKWYAIRRQRGEM